MFRGIQGFGQTMKDFLATLLLSIGQAVIAMGVAAVAAGVLTLNGELVARGLIAIAAGAAAIAASVALGGGGGGAGTAVGGAGATAVPTFAFDQSQIDVQPSFIQATDNLNESAAEFRTATDRLTSMPPSEVVMTGNNQMGGATRVLSTDLKKGRSISAGRDVALSLRGGS